MPRLELQTQLELRKCDDGAEHLRGHAAVFYDEQRSDETTFVMPSGIEERVAPGAFNSTLAGGDEVIALLQHDPEQVLARRSAGTLSLTSDETGLVVDMKLADTTRARDLAEDIRVGNINGMSFGFRVPQGGAHLAKNVRTLVDVDLKEVSVVTCPAYEGARVGLRFFADDEEQEMWRDWQFRQRRARLLELDATV